MLCNFRVWWKNFQSTEAKGIYASLAAHSGQISVGLSQGFSAVLIPKLLETNEAGIVEASWIASLGVVSNPLGALIAGTTAEYFGRRAAIALATLPHATGWLFIALSTNMSMLYVGRFISGIGAGMANALYLYVTEVAAPCQRSWLGSCGPVLVSVGVLGSYALGALTTWQSTAAISIGPAILSLALTRLIPESPAWLARKGRFPEAQQALFWLRGPGIACETEYKELCGDSSVERRKKCAKLNPLTALIRPNVWKPFVILFIFFALQQTSGIYIILFYAVNVMKDIGNSDEYFDEYAATVVIGVVRLIASIFGAFLASQCGRRTLASSSAVGMAASAILVALCLYYKQYTDIIPQWLPIVAIASHVAFSMIGYLTLPWVMTSELYPLRFRGVMGGLTTGLAQIMTFVAVKVYPEFSNTIGLQMTMVIFGVASVLGAIFGATILPETKGKSLEEIERRFSTGDEPEEAEPREPSVFVVGKYSQGEKSAHDNLGFEHEVTERRTSGDNSV